MGRQHPDGRAAGLLGLLGLHRGSGLTQGRFFDRINEIVRSLHADGELKRLSMQFFGTDYTSAAAAFDLASLRQEVP